jgi:hypothetical protein
MEYSTDIDGWNIRGVQLNEHKSYDSVSYAYVLIRSNDGHQEASIDANGDIEVDLSSAEEDDSFQPIVRSIPVNVMIVAIEMWKTIMNLPQ